MNFNEFTFRAKLWIYPGEAAWYFITVPKKESQIIKTRFEALKRGWGSLPVTVKVGNSSWRTSIFPDKKAGAYLLPIKSAIRKKEKTRAGDTLDVYLEIRDVA